MRKIIALTLAVLLVGSMALASFAEFHPSVDGDCGHEVSEVIVNGKEIDIEGHEGAFLVVTAEDAAEVNEALDPSKPDQVTSTGLTYDENAALVGMYDIVRTLRSFPAYIAAHKLSKVDADLPLDTAEKTLEMAQEELDAYDFLHFFIVRINEAKLKELASLTEDENITSLELVYNCDHMTNTSIMLHEEDILADGNFDNIEIVDNEIVIHAVDVDFAVGEAKTGGYTISFDLTNGKTLPEYSLFTIVAKEAN